MLKLEFLQQVLLFSPLLLQGIIIWRMVVSGARRNFPLFLSYVVFQTLAFLVGMLVLVYGNQQQYRYFYGAQSLVVSGLLFAAIYEVFSNVFRPYEALRDFAGVVFRWAALVLIVVASLQAFSTQSAKHSALVVGIVIFERSVGVVACGLLLFMLLFSKHLGVDWRSQVYGVGLGLGLGYGIELVLLTMRLLFACPLPVIDLCRSITWNCTLVLWSYYLFVPERKTAEAFAPKLILERWNQVLRGVNRPAPQGAFMPNLEKIVDDVMAHQASTGTVH
jgi:hypothetical protein